MAKTWKRSLDSLSEPCGPVVVNRFWMQKYLGFDLFAAKIFNKSHYFTHYGCKSVHMNIWKKDLSRTIPPIEETRSGFLINLVLTILSKIIYIFSAN